MTDQINKLTKSFLTDINHLLAAYVREQTILGWKLKEERENEADLYRNMYVASIKLTNHLYGKKQSPISISPKEVEAFGLALVDQITLATKTTKTFHADIDLKTSKHPLSWLKR